MNTTNNPEPYRKNIPISSDEIDKFESFIKNLGKNIGLKLLYIKNQLTEIVNPDYPNAKYAQNLAICAEAVFIPANGSVIIGKNKPGDSVLFKSMTVKLEKIERDGDISFNIWVTFKGFIKIYRQRDIEPLWMPGRFLHSKSIETFDYSFIQNNVERLLTFVKITPATERKLKKMWNAYYDNVEK